MNKRKIYSIGFLIPAFIIFLIFFLVPLLLSFFYSLTIWDFDSVKFCGLDNFKMFFSERSLNTGIKNTLIYAILTSGLKVFLAFLLAVFLTSGIKTRNFLRSVIFFPNLVSTIAVGLTFKALMHPSKGLFNRCLQWLGFQGVDWLGNTDIALFSIVAVDVWKGIGIATVIYIAGISAIDSTYYEAASIDGAAGIKRLCYITVPLCRSSMNTVIILSLIGGLRSFDLIYAMTGGGPGFATEVVAMSVYKQYASGYYGLSTAGNVIMLLMIGIIAYPLKRFLMSKEAG